MQTDVDFLLEVLQDGLEHELSEILDRSSRERGCGLTVHSRVADLRKRGWNIKNHQVRKGDGRSLSMYRLIGLKETSGAAAAAGGDATGVSLNPSDAPTAEVFVYAEEEWELLRTLDLSSSDQLELIAPAEAPRGAYSEAA